MTQKDYGADFQRYLGLAIQSLLASVAECPEATIVVQPAALSADNAAAYIGVSRSRFFDLKKETWTNGKPKIPTTNVDGQPRYLKKHLDKYLKDCESESN